jgi:hypothetical protein
MKTSTLVIIGGAAALAVGAFAWHAQQVKAAGTPVNNLVPGGVYLIAAPATNPATALAMASAAGWADATAATATPALQAAANANGLSLTSPNTVIFKGTYNGIATPLIAPAVAVRLS